MTAVLEKSGVTVDFGSIEITGTLVHDDEQRALYLIDDEDGIPEDLSTSLAAYGVTAEPGHVIIKDWSEHAGLTERLQRAGLVTPVHRLAVGPFASTAYEVEVTVR